MTWPDDEPQERRLAEGRAMNDTSVVPRDQADRVPVPRQVIDAEQANQLLGRAQAEAGELLGPDGLLSQVTRAVLERALAEEMTGHLGYDKQDPAGRGSGNSRNGTSAKTVLTDIGAWTWPFPGTGTAASSRSPCPTRRSARRPRTPGGDGSGRD